MANTKQVSVAGLAQYFESLSDPRHEKNRLHKLVDIMVISVCAILCGATGPTGIARWAKARGDWLAQFLELPEGIPSRDCIRRVLIALQPQAFQECFAAWLLTCVDDDSTGDRRLVAIDGKTCRGSHDRSKGLGPLHIVSAWASEQGIALGQVATEEKSNEITAIPQLLQRLDLARSTVTIDAMGCQKEIVAQIHKAKGAYVIAVKDNQPKLRAAVEELVQEQLEAAREDLQFRVSEVTEQGHGRVDERSYGVIKLPRSSRIKEQWPSVRAVGYAVRITIDATGQETFDTRYYVLNRYSSISAFASAVRGHWSIESMHWVLDVTFREDAQQTAERSLANNLSWLRKHAITLLKRGLQKGDSIVGRMQMSGWSTSYLEQVLCGQ